jgi:predicted hotdog family 3-hydroxylacyl-ACP dehydratase
MNTYPIEHVLPHAHPMILLDSLLEFSATTAVCAVRIAPHSNFYNVERNTVPSYVGLEYMAQTIAAYANVLKLEEGGLVSLGFLVSARNYTARVSEFGQGAELIVSVELLLKESNGLSVFDCKIMQQGELLVDAKINVFEPDDPEQYLLEQDAK